MTEAAIRHQPLALFSLCAVAALSLFAYGPEQESHSAQIQPSVDALSVIVLLDSSGSMQSSDPRNLRVAAAQALVSLLGPQDEVAVIEFDSEARTLTGPDQSLWVSASQHQELFQAISRTNNRGQKTDFRAALRSAQVAIQSGSAQNRKVILLLSDGVLDPNPLASEYGEHRFMYRAAVAAAGRERRRQIDEEYRQILSPIARRIIFDEIIPRLRDAKVEIFTVGLGPEADRAFLNSLTQELTLNASEVHSFYAEKPTDLVGVFTGLLQYWTEMTVLQTTGGPIRPPAARTIFLDEFVEAPRALVLIDGHGQFFLRTDKGEDEQQEIGTHSNLAAYTLRQSVPPGTWAYGFADGEGQYQVIWAGKNLLRLSVDGLRSRYDFGEMVEAHANLTVRGQSASHLLLPDSRIVAEVSRLPASAPTEQVLEKATDWYSFRFSPPASGRFTLHFIANARDRQGRDILPRPSLLYQVEVMPAFYVFPARLKFGRGKPGESLTREIEVHSGLKDNVDVGVGGEIKRSSGKALQQGKTQELPTLESTRFLAVAGTVSKQRLTLKIPKTASGGDHEGEIVFQASSGEKYVIEFSTHVLTWWERYRILFFGALVFIALLGAYLAYVWGFIGSPHGVLVPLQAPAIAVVPTLRLSELHRGVFTRWLNWNRHRLRIASSYADIVLPDLPVGLRTDLFFYRWGRCYVRNSSVAGSDHCVRVAMPEVDTFELMLERSVSFGHGTNIEIGPYVFQYQDR